MQEVPAPNKEEALKVLFSRMIGLEVLAIENSPYVTGNFCKL